MVDTFSTARASLLSGVTVPALTAWDQKKCLPSRNRARGRYRHGRFSLRDAGAMALMAKLTAVNFSIKDAFDLVEEGLSEIERRSGADLNDPGALGDVIGNYVWLVWIKRPASSPGVVLLEAVRDTPNGNSTLTALTGKNAPTLADAAAVLLDAGRIVGAVLTRATAFTQELPPPQAAANDSEQERSA